MASYKILLKDSQIEYLSNLPENGMGYHIVDLILKNGSIMKGKIVVNCMYLQLDYHEELKIDEVDRIELHVE
jgi:hypothetical protein